MHGNAYTTSSDDRAEVQDWVLPKPTENMDTFGDSHLYLGTSETRSSLMACLEHLTSCCDGAAQGC